MFNWNPALPNGTYQVQVRAFKNGAWCVTSLPWGDECNATITGSPNAISVDIFDLSGARVSSRTMAVNDGMVYQVLSLGELADGLYMVNITAGTQRYTERLVIAQ
jgi:hypothetical protein